MEVLGNDLDGPTTAALLALPVVDTFPVLLTRLGTLVKLVNGSGSGGVFSGMGGPANGFSLSSTVVALVVNPLDAAEVVVVVLVLFS